MAFNLTSNDKFGSFNVDIGFSLLFGVETIIGIEIKGLKPRNYYAGLSRDCFFGGSLGGSYILNF